VVEEFAVGPYVERTEQHIGEIERAETAIEVAHVPQNERGIDGEAARLGAGNDTLMLYSLPYTGAIVYTDTPPQNQQKTCDPVAGGFDKKELHIKIGDAGCHVDEIRPVASNTWKIIYNTDFSVPIEGLFVKSLQGSSGFCRCSAALAGLLVRS